MKRSELRVGKAMGGREICRWRKTGLRFWMMVEEGGKEVERVRLGVGVGEVSEGRK